MERKREKESKLAGWLAACQEPAGPPTPPLSGLGSSSTATECIYIYTFTWVEMERRREMGRYGVLDVGKGGREKCGDYKHIYR